MVLRRPAPIVRRPRVGTPRGRRAAEAARLRNVPRGYPREKRNPPCAGHPVPSCPGQPLLPTSRGRPAASGRRVPPFVGSGFVPLAGRTHGRGAPLFQQCLGHFLHDAEPACALARLCRGFRGAQSAEYRGCSGLHPRDHAFPRSAPDRRTGGRPAHPGAGEPRVFRAQLSRPAHGDSARARRRSSRARRPALSEKRLRSRAHRRPLHPRGRRVA